MSAAIPHDLDLERETLAAAIVDPTSRATVVGLPIDAWYAEPHRVIARALSRMDGREVTEALLVAELDAHGELGAAGGVSAVNRLTDHYPDVIGVGPQCAHLRRLAAERGALIALEQVVADQWRPDSIDRAERALAAVRGASGEVGGHGLRALTLREILDWQIPPREPLLEPFLFGQDLGMVYAPRGVGKTMLMLSVALSVAAGREVVPGWLPPASGAPVLYVDGEMPGALMQERLRRLQLGAGIGAGVPLRILTPDAQRGRGLPDLATGTGQAALEAVIGDSALVILDNLSSLCGAAENDADAWRPMQTWLLRQRQAGRTVTIVHHAGRGGQPRGTSRREDALDLVIGLTRPDGYHATEGAKFVVRFGKARSLAGGVTEDLELSLETTPDGGWTWGRRAAEAATRERCIRLAGQGMTGVEIAAELNIHKSTVSRHLRAGGVQGRRESSSDGPEVPW